jgi:hypothetical protein
LLAECIFGSLERTCGFSSADLYSKFDKLSSDGM